MLVLMQEAAVGRNWSRKLMVLLTTVCMLLGSFEALIPDIHDGDFASATIEDSGAPVLARDHGSLPPAPPAPSHSQHVEHCTHMHGEGLPAFTGLCLTTIEHAYGLAAPDQSPSDIHVAPHRRPPIA
jgi:hypothetical protein